MVILANPEESKSIRQSHVADSDLMAKPWSVSTASAEVNPDAGVKLTGARSRTRLGVESALEAEQPLRWSSKRGNPASLRASKHNHQEANLGQLNDKAEAPRTSMQFPGESLASEGSEPDIDCFPVECVLSWPLGWRELHVKQQGVKISSAQAEPNEERYRVRGTREAGTSFPRESLVTNGAIGRR